MCIPNLPESLIQYVNVCGQCVIGVKVTDGNATARQQRLVEIKGFNDCSFEEVEPKVRLFDIMQDNTCQIDLDSS